MNGQRRPTTPGPNIASRTRLPADEITSGRDYQRTRLPSASRRDLTASPLALTGWTILSDILFQNIGRRIARFLLLEGVRGGDSWTAAGYSDW
jgi:hypothetical protein